MKRNELVVGATRVVQYRWWVEEEEEEEEKSIYRGLLEPEDALNWKRTENGVRRVKSLIND